MKNMTENISGMNIMTLACIGSGGAGLKRICRKLKPAMMIGRML